MPDAPSLPRPRQTRWGTLRCAWLEGDARMPEKVDVAVIGGGILGVTIARELALAGKSVAVLEKAEIGCEASSRAFGWISELLVGNVKQEMTQLGKRLWPELHAACGETGYRRGGIAYFARNADEMGFYEGWLADAAGHLAPDTRLLGPDEVAARYPGAASRFAGALFAPSDASAEPTIATAAIAASARAAGAAIVTGCSVRAIDSQAGAVRGLHTSKGYLGCEQVVVAANAWSRLFLGRHGVDVPQLYVLMSMGRTGAVAGGPVGAGGTEAWAFRECIDGSYDLGGVAGVRGPVTRDALRLYRRFKPIMEMMGGAKPDFGRDALRDLSWRRRWKDAGPAPFDEVVLAGRTDTSVAAASLRDNAGEFAALGATGVAETWSGAIAMAPDNNPIVGPVAQLPGVWLATACSYGIGWAPAIGAALGAALQGKPAPMDLAPFRLERFFDGSALEMSH